MAEETKTQGAAGKKKTKKAAPPEEEFDVNKYIIGEETLPFKVHFTLPWLIFPPFPYSY